MALFNKQEPKPKPTPTKQVKVMTNKASGDVISSIISQDMKIIGEMNFKGKARVDGTVEGNIKGDHLVLSESGKVFGDLELATLICNGSIEGNVKAQQVTAHSTSSIRGNLVATSLTVESGAQLNGEVSSSAKPQQQVTPKPAPAAATQKTEPEKKEEAKN